MSLPPCPCGAVCVKGDEGHADDCPYPCYVTNKVAIGHWERERERIRRIRNIAAEQVDTLPSVSYKPLPDTAECETMPELFPDARIEAKRKRKPEKRNADTLFALRCEECKAILLETETGMLCPYGHGKLIVNDPRDEAFGPPRGVDKPPEDLGMFGAHE